MEGTTAPVKKGTPEMDITAQVCVLTVYNSIFYAIVYQEVGDIQ